MNLRFQPKDGYVGDIIPYFYRGKYHLFYLKTSIKNTGMDRSLQDWGHIVSEDLTEWKELPKAIKRGKDPLSPDHNGAWTGDIIEKDGVFHIFYTGFNRETEMPQTICHATSTDLISWKKDLNNPLLKPDSRWYELKDWRDPFVFYNKGKGLYYMIINARVNFGPKLRRGCLALAISSDLLKWENKPPFWAPYDAFAMDCPQLFKENNKWYLIYSPFDKLNYGTVYRFSNHLEGPWSIPSRRGLDGRRFYAAKTTSNGKRRFAFSWVHSRKGRSNNGDWELGGRMAIPHELIFEENGNIAVKCPTEVLKLYSKIDFEFKPMLGEVVAKDNVIKFKDEDHFSYGFLTNDKLFKKENLLLEVSIQIENKNNVGFLVRVDDDLTKGFIVKIIPSCNKVTFERFPQLLEPLWENMISNSVKKPLFKRDISNPLIERPLNITKEKKIDCLLFISGSLIEVYIDNKIALTHRVYRPDYHYNEIGIFTEGKVVFNNIQLKSQKK